jgi:uncharacterized membrane protein
MAELVGQVFDLNVNDSSFVGMLQKINSFTDVGQGGVMGIWIMLIVGGALFLMMRSYGNERAFAVASLITGLIGLFLRLLSLISDKVFWVSIVLMILGVIFLIKEQGQYEG